MQRVLRFLRAGLKRLIRGGAATRAREQGTISRKDG